MATDVRIPTNLITGFLGAGKTTAILSLLKRKPEQERWAVLVNEFGEVGVDGAILQGQGAVVREVPGGCLCCVAGVPMQVALNRLIAREKPDRLLIEPSGLGHPARVLELLRSPQYRRVLELKATLGLVDPRKLGDERYTGHSSFRDQLNLADILVGTKDDLLTESDRQRFMDWSQSFQPPKAASGLVRHGEFPLQWLDTAANSEMRAENPQAHGEVSAGALSLLDLTGPQYVVAPKDCRRFEGKGYGPERCGWVFGSAIRFDCERLVSLFWELNVARAKAVMATDKGWRVFNLSDGVLSDYEMNTAVDSRLEVIAGNEPPNWDSLESAIFSCRID